MSHLQDPPPEWLTDTYMEVNLRRCFRDPLLKVESIDIQPGSSIGDNYTCQVLRIVLKITNSSSGLDTLSIIAKLKPFTAVSQEFKKDFDMFDNEVNFFTILQPKLIKVIEQFPNKNTYMPKFYLADIEKGILFMEDLKKDDFVMHKRCEFLDFKQAELAMDALATFHGALYHVGQKEDLRNIFPRCTWGEPPKPILLLFKNGALSLKKNMALYGLPERYQRKLLQIQDELDNGKLKESFTDDGHTFLGHGDCWKNNVMYHYTDGNADDIKLIDFQGVNFSPIGVDLQYFFFLSVSSDVLVSKLDLLLERYFKKIREIAPDIPGLSLELIKSEFTKRYYFGYVLAVLCRTVVIAKTAVDMGKVMREDGIQDNGFDDPTFINDLHNFLPLFEKAGIL